jgi:hypothetical protein
MCRAALQSRVWSPDWLSSQRCQIHCASTPTPMKALNGYHMAVPGSHADRLFAESDAHWVPCPASKALSVGSDALNERGTSRQRAPVAQWIEHLTSDCPDVCSMRHEGNGHAKQAGSDALSERGPREGGLACPSRFCRTRTRIRRLGADALAGQTRPIGCVGRQRSDAPVVGSTGVTLTVAT